MAYTFAIKIDGVEIPPPSGYSFNEADLVANSQRNAQGYATWDVIRQNVGNMELTWDNIDGVRLKRVVSAIRSKKTFKVTFFNTFTGSWETRTFYSGDRSSELARYASAQRYWASLTIPFVEV